MNRLVHLLAGWWFPQTFASDSVYLMMLFNQDSLGIVTSHQSSSAKNHLEMKPNTLRKTNIAMENQFFSGKYQQHGGFPMAMVVYRST